jgi:hypothetical protein
MESVFLGETMNHLIVETSNKSKPCNYKIVYRNILVEEKCSKYVVIDIIVFYDQMCIGSQDSPVRGPSGESVESQDGG